ncbi:AbrB family transcriptional regulator [Faunimonas sp. B44]
MGLNVGKTGGWGGRMPGPAATVGLLLAGAAGAAAYSLHVPLAWVLGPLIATATFTLLTGMEPFAPVTGRRIGQLLVGSTIGLNLTPEIFGMLVGWLPLMIVSALVSILVSASFARALARLGRIDVKSAYFALMPGGLAEMANVGAREGAQSEPIALVQAVRIALVVCILPPLIVSLGVAGDFHALDRLSDLPAIEVPLLLAGGLAAVMLLRLTPLNNPWVVGALIGAATLSATGLLEGRMPRPVFYLGQFLIGIVIGARFRREIVLKLARVAVSGAFLVVVITALLILYGLLIAHWGGIDFGSAALSASPGGFAEMAATAEALHLNVAIVTGFHITRSLFVNSLSTHYWAILDRIGFFRIGSRTPPSS